MLFVGPRGPDVHSLFSQGRFVCPAREKPEQLLGNPAERDLFCRYDRKAFTKIKACLIAKMRYGSDACPVVMLLAIYQNRFEQVVVLFHEYQTNNPTSNVQCPKVNNQRRSPYVGHWTLNRRWTFFGIALQYNGSTSSNE